MASVGAYLNKLLFQYDCVVVPELGGFLTHYQPAGFVANTGQFLPPRKRLAFNEALRLDDGILINYIMLHESLSREDSARLISDFVNDLKQHVSLAGSFSVDGIGLFTPNVEGKLQFDPELRHNFFGESFGMTAIQAEKVISVPVETVEAEEVPMYSLGPVRRDQVLEESPFIGVSRPRPLLRWAAAAVLVGSLGALSYLTVIEPGQPMESSLNPTNWFRVPAWLQSSQKAEPVKEIAMARPIPEPVLAIPATTEASLATPAVATTPIETPEVRTEPVAPVSAKPVDTKATPEEAKKAKVAIENSVLAEPIAEAKAEKVAPKIAVKRFKDPLFTVVAGSFASKTNAVRFRRTLRKAGYSDAFIIQPSREGQLYKVAAIGSPIREDAIASTDSLKKLTGVTPFIMRN